jgi:putative toxin-antitoxin system antitoxin component (TIGR02293 family)
VIRKSKNSVDRSRNIQRFQEASRAGWGELAVVVHQGIPATEVEDLAELLALPFDELCAALSLPPSTIRRKARNREALPADQGERVLGLQRMVGQIQTIVEECGNPKGFDAAIWAGNWLTSPLPALEGHRGIEYLGTITGQQLLSDLLMRNISGAYS